MEDSTDHCTHSVRLSVCRKVKIKFTTQCQMR